MMRSVLCSHPDNQDGGDLKDFLTLSSPEQSRQTKCFFLMPPGGSISLPLVKRELVVSDLYKPDSPRI